MEFTLRNLLLIVLIAWLAGRTVKRYGLPSVLGELAAGILFGPPLLGLIHGDNGVTVLGRLGILMSMLYIGTRISPRELVKAARSSVWVAIAGVGIPFILGFAATLLLGIDRNMALVAGVVVGVTALTSVPRMVVEMKLTETRIGQTLIGGAILIVFIVLIAFSIVSGIAGPGGLQLGKVALVVAKALAFVVLIALVGTYVFPQIGKLLARQFTGRTDDLAFAMVIGIGAAMTAELFGLTFIFGAFLAGIFLRSEMFETGIFPDLLSVVNDVALGLLAPIFYVSAGFNVSFTVLQTNPLLLITILVVAVVGKLAGALLAYVLTGRNWREGLVVGIGLNGRAGADIVLSGIALQTGIINKDIFTALILTAFVTTLLMPILLRMGVGWLRQRNELIPANAPTPPSRDVLPAGTPS